MSKPAGHRKGRFEWGRRVKVRGEPGRRGKRKTWLERPSGSQSGRGRCTCHYTYPCPRLSVAK